MMDKERVSITKFEAFAVRRMKLYRSAAGVPCLRLDDLETCSPSYSKAQCKKCAEEEAFMQEITRLVTEAVTLNEIGSDPSLKYKFSFAGGPSGLSFGAVQFDISHNKTARSCLRSCDFTPQDIDLLLKKADEIKRAIARGGVFDINALLAKDPEIKSLNAKLAAASEIVDSYDIMHITESIDHCTELVNGSGIDISCIEAMVGLVDYHNQYWMTPGGKIHTWLREQGQPVTPDMMLEFRLSTLWGKKRPDDVHRRHDNITRICAEPLKEGVCHD